MARFASNATCFCHAMFRALGPSFRMSNGCNVLRTAKFLFGGVEREIVPTFEDFEDFASASW